MTDTAIDITGIVAKLDRAWRTGDTVILQENECAMVMQDALEINKRLCARAAPEAYAHKLGATTFASRQALQVETEFFGCVPREKTLTAPARIHAAQARHRKVEAEVAFVFGAPMSALGPSPNKHRIADLISGVLPAIEIPETRYPDLGIYGGIPLIADAGAAGWAVLGEEQVFHGPDNQMGYQVSLTFDGVEVSSGDVSAIDGGPFQALLRHCQSLHREGYDISQGTVVLAGACTACVPAPVDAQIVADFGLLGTVSMCFTS